MVLQGNVWIHFETTVLIWQLQVIGQVLLGRLFWFDHAAIPMADLAQVGHIARDEVIAPNFYQFVNVRILKLGRIQQVTHVGASLS